MWRFFQEKPEGLGAFFELGHFSRGDGMKGKISYAS